MRDALHIVWSKVFEAAVTSSSDNIWMRRFNERVNILFNYVILR